MDYAAAPHSSGLSVGSDFACQPVHRGPVPSSSSLDGVPRAGCFTAALQGDGGLAPPSAPSVGQGGASCGPDGPVPLSSSMPAPPYGPTAALAPPSVPSVGQGGKLWS